MKRKILRILVAFDGSAASEEAFAAMMPVVRLDNPDVAVLYAVEPPVTGAVPPAGLAEACERLRAQGVDAHLALREGKPADEILRFAADRQPDLIVMETEGRSGLPRLAKRSVAEEVLRQTEVPVLLVRPGAARRAWSRILVALDGSSRAEEILQDVVPLAERLDASVELVRAALPTPTGMALPDDPKPYLRQVQVRLLQEGIDARIAAVEGRASAAILERAREISASLIALTTHGRTGVERILMGSIAEEVVRHAPCPVLIRRSVRTDGLALDEGRVEHLKK